MVNNKFAIAIIGLGGMGSAHHEFIKGFEHIFVKGIFDIAPSRVEYARSQGIYAYESLEAVLDDKDIDIVTITTPNDFHKPIAIAAMAKGKNVVSEKPVTLGSADLQEMIDASKKYGVLFTVHQNRRWDEDFLTIKKLYDEGTLGEIFNIESRVHGSRGIPGDWRGDKAQGGGMMLDWGVHIIDQMLQMVHEKIKKVYAIMQYITTDEVDDGFKLMLTFESGKTALLEVGTSNFISLPRWYVQGQNGTVVIEDWSMNGKIVSIQSWEKKDVVPIKTAAGLTKTMAPRTDDTIKEYPLPKVTSDLHDFYINVVDTISGKAQIIVKHNELMRVMKLMEAAFLSDRTGQVIDFE
jgi:scyllo-inositol 2-dehydrogenase (NADP+)